MGFALHRVVYDSSQKIWWRGPTWPWRSVTRATGISMEIRSLPKRGLSRGQPRRSRGRFRGRGAKERSGVMTRSSSSEVEVNPLPSCRAASAIKTARGTRERESWFDFYLLSASDIAPFRVSIWSAKYQTLSHLPLTFVSVKIMKWYVYKTHSSINLTLRRRANRI